MVRGLVVVAMLVALTSGAADFKHELTGVKPWTNENFLDDPQEFHFAVIGDRTGGERKGFFPKTMAALNLLRPEFVMSVGDLIDGRGVREPELRRQWKEVEGFLSQLKMPFFYVVGNHDIWTGFTGMTVERAESIKVWKELHGEKTYYSFLYKGCQFICLDTMIKHDYFPPREALSQEMVDWAATEIEAHPEARWRFIFMHKPIDWTSDRWLAFERRINRFDYTVFCGDWHHFCTATRHGKKYYMVGTAGGGWDYGKVSEDLRYGVMDGITWVTMTKDGPVVSFIGLNGIYGDTIQTCATTRGWVETPLDYPSHLAEPTEKYAGETNTALIPTEVMKGPGYDWHFRHAVILRQGLVYEAKIENFEVGGKVQDASKRRVLLLGDESATALAKNYPEDQVFDMGFAGDRIENVLWRVQQGELRGYDPDMVVISVGKHNTGKNSPEEIAAGLRKLEQMVRARVPRAKILL